MAKKLIFRRAHVVRACAALVVTAGYALLGAGDITAAPVLLVLGYIVLVPLAIAWS